MFFSGNVLFTVWSNPRDQYNDVRLFASAPTSPFDLIEAEFPDSIMAQQGWNVLEVDDGLSFISVLHSTTGDDFSDLYVSGADKHVFSLSLSRLVTSGQFDG